MGRRCACRRAEVATLLRFCEALHVAAGRVVVIADGEALARRTGLLDRGGRPVRGLPVPVVAGGACDAAAVWRGAFLVQGSLSEPGRSPVLEVGCPGLEAAMALVGAARRLGITTQTRSPAT